MKRTYLLLVLILPFFLCTCNRSRKTDHSLTLEAYRELGVKDPGKVWNLQDFIMSNMVLTELKNEQPFALPTKSSRRSSALFYRMISLENMSFLQDDSLPLYEKAHRLQGFLNVYTDLADLYTNVLMKEQYYYPELVEIWIFGLSVSQKMIDLGQEINQSDVPADKRMAAGYESIQSLYLVGLQDVLNQQKYTSRYSEKELELLTDSISVAVKRNMDWFDKAASDKLKLELQAVIDSTSSRKIRHDYLDLIDRL